MYKSIATALLVFLSVCCDATADQHSIKIGITHNPPISVHDENGGVSGLVVDVLDDIAARQGWVIEYVPGKWSSLIKQLEAGELDLQTGVAFSEERAARFDFNETALVVNWGVLYRTPQAEFTSVAELDGANVAMIPNTTHTKAFLQLLDDFDIQPVAVDVADYEQAFSKMDTGAASFAVVSRLYGIINSNRHDVIETAMNFNPIEVRFAAPKGKSARILSDIDAYLKTGKSTAGSNYHQYLRKYLVASRDGTLSTLVLWIAGIASGAFGLTILVAWGLKREVTRRTRSLQESQSKLLEAQYISKFGDYDWDLKKNLVTYSDGLNHLLKQGPLPPITLEDALKRSMHPDEVEPFRIWIEDAFKSGAMRLEPKTFRLLCGNGDVIHAETIMGIEYEGKDAVRVFGTYHDVTDRFLSEQALLKALARADAANAAKSEFLATMSHELRTPLNAILGFAELLKMKEINIKNPLSETQNGYVDNIAAGGTHLLNLVNDVLDVTQIETDRINLSVERIDLKETVQQCVRQIGALAQRRGIDIQNFVKDGADYSLLGDGLRLKQVLINLLSNAIKYNIDGGKIIVSAEQRDNGKVRISIEDTGIGISNKHQPDVFQAFNRLGADPLLTREGTGIGLTVSKLLMEKMGGSIGFKSTEGIGSTFWFELAVFPS